MNIAQIEENVKSLLADLASGKCKQDAFIYELLLAYGHRKQSVSRLRSGERNMASKSNTPCHDEIIWKRHLHYKHVEGDALHAEIDQMRNDKLVRTNKIRFVIVTNFDQLLAVDTKTSDSLDITLDELPKQFDFFLPWAGMEKAVYQGENPADVKAAEKMAKLFDLIKSDNFDESNRHDTSALHNLNVFLTRLLFCFFAEDTEIFENNQFSLAIRSHTKDDGGDLSGYLNRLFTVLNTADVDRGELPDYLSIFPYVNGGLFADNLPSPKFSAKSRRMLIECGSELDWSDINPDIFGSMFQAVVHPDQRGGMGMHYTSVTNIMKVIEPLFLSDLYEELDRVDGSANKLQKLQQRLGRIKIFDPACGSGNFLIIAYKEIRKLEMELLKRLQELELKKTGQISQPFSVITLSQFYGIELDDFAHEVAILSLWLAEHQLNVEFKVEFGECAASLPLKKGGNVVCGNAAVVSWGEVCPIAVGDETYLLGNPPYLGSSLQSKSHKSDMSISLASSLPGYKNLDYISIWFFKGANYLSRFENGADLAFVSTNSICQGEQVSLLWQDILDIENVEISFAYQSFKWRNNARDNAAVTCVIVGLSTSRKPKYLFDNDVRQEVKNINPYLVESETNVILSKRRQPLSDLPQMVYGSKPTDGGGLILDVAERDDLLTSYPNSSKFVKKYVGASEHTSNRERWCLWIDDGDIDEAMSIPTIRNRISSVKAFRDKSSKEATKKLSLVPHRFGEPRYQPLLSILVPIHGSDRRKYIPFGILNADVIASNAVQVLYCDDLFIFGLISSYIHNLWIKVSCGKIKEDPRYSSTLGYNNFPIPVVGSIVRKKITAAAFGVLEARERYPERNLAELYDPDLMPPELLSAHTTLDELVEAIYKKAPFTSDVERLEFLFKQYEKMKG